MPRFGENPLPKLNGFTAPITDFGIGVRFKEAVPPIDFLLVQKYLESFSRLVDKQSVGVFGVRRLDGTFSYTYGSFVFEKSGPISQRNALVAFHQKDSLGYVRVAIALIPETEEALTSFTRWLEPKVTEEEMGAKKNKSFIGDSAPVTKDCYFFELTSGYWVSITMNGETSSRYVPPVSIVICADDNGGGGGGGSDSGSSGGGGAGGGTTGECSNMYKWGCEDNEDEEIEEDPEKPCAIGDPVKNPTIAAQTNSGVKGGSYGPYRTYNDGSAKWHHGIDISNPVGSKIYSMYSGKVLAIKDNPDGWGKYMFVHSVVNGESYMILYAHLDPDNLFVTEGQVIDGSTPLALQGTSGSLLGAINKGSTIPHVHIEVGKKVNNTSVYKRVDPETILRTEFSENGTAINPLDC